jgi:hypothetical protein
VGWPVVSVGIKKKPVGIKKKQKKVYENTRKYFFQKKFQKK